LFVILSKRSLRSEGPGRSARSVAGFATHNRAFGSHPPTALLSIRLCPWRPWRTSVRS